jgi:hypothetical protein
MEIWDLYASSIEELFSYTRTRFAPAVFVPLALFLYAASAAGAGLQRWTDVLLGAALAYMLLFQLRLCDDLADCDSDAARFPDRILVASPSITKYRLLVALVFAVNVSVIALQSDFVRLAAFLTLNVALFIWYGYLRNLVQSPLIRSHILLLKYPVLVFALSGLFVPVDPIYLGYSMLLVYLAFCNYEWLHDPAFTGEKHAFHSLVVEGTVLVTAPLWILSLLPWPDRSLVTLSIVLVLLTAFLAIYVVGRYLARNDTGLWTYAPFLIALFHILLINAWSTT